MKRIIGIFVIAVIVTTLITGCYDYGDVEESALVAGIAIDKSASGYEVTAELLSMKSSSSEAVPNSVIISKTSRTVEGALELIVTTNVRKLYFGHCVIALISKTVASEGIRDLVDYFFHDNKINVSLDMIVVKGERAADVFKCTTVRGSLVSFDVSKALRETSEDNSTTKSVKVYECISAMENPGGEAFLPAIGVEEIAEEKRFSIEGIAVLKGDSLVGFLSVRESIYFLMLTDELNDGSLEIEMSEEEYLHFNILSDKISVAPQKEDPSIIDISVLLDLSLMHIPEGLDIGDKSSIQSYEQKVCSEVKESLIACINKIRDGYKSDILSYGYLMYKASPELFRQIDDDSGYFEELDFNINVTAKLKSSGLSDMAIDGEA